MYPFNDSGALQKCSLRNWGYNGGLVYKFFYSPLHHSNIPYSFVLYDRACDGVQRHLYFLQNRFSPSGNRIWIYTETELSGISVSSSPDSDGLSTCTAKDTSRRKERDIPFF